MTIAFLTGLFLMSRILKMTDFSFVSCIGNTASIRNHVPPPYLLPK